MSDKSDGRKGTAPDDTLGAFEGAFGTEPKIVRAGRAKFRQASGLSRRDFLKGGLLAGATMKIVGCGGGGGGGTPDGWSRECVAQYYPSHTDTIRSFAFSPDGTRIATAGDDHQVKVWNAATGELLLTYQGHASPVNAVVFSPNGQRCASIGDTLHIWNASTGALLVDHGALAGYALAYSPDGSRVVAGLDYGSVYAFDAESASGSVLVFSGAYGKINSLAFSPDGKKLVGACAYVCVWDASTRVLLRTYTAQSPSADVPVNAAVFSPDSTKIASAGSNTTVHVWNAEDGTLQVQFTGHTNAVTSVTFDSTGTQVVSCSSEASYLWSAAGTGSLATHLEGFIPATVVAFSPDGSRLALARLNQYWKQTNGQFSSAQECKVVVELTAGSWAFLTQLGDTSLPPVGQVDSTADCNSAGTIPGSACHCDVVCGCDLVCTCDAQGGCPNVICLIVF